MKVAILADAGNADGSLGGAELTMREFALAAPDDVDLVHDATEAEVVVIGNCVHLDPKVVNDLRGREVIRYHNDLARSEPEEIRDFLAQWACHVYTSPMHRKLYGEMRDDDQIIPPPIDLQAFKPTRQVKRHGTREGVCAIAAWHNPGKGQRLVREWSETHGEIDVYGPGQFVPAGPKLNFKGPLEPSDVAQTLWAYERFVFLPTEPEPFGRCAVEAWAAGCELVVNEQIGALHYIRHDHEALGSAATNFWALVKDRVAA